MRAKTLEQITECEAATQGQKRLSFILGTVIP